jgi:nicotinamidase-related amidase
MSDLHLDPKKTALVLIDLQNGILATPTAPHSVNDVLEKSRQLAQSFRAKGGTVIYVRVDINNVLHLPVDQPMRSPTDPPLPASASELSPQSGFQPGDIVITKRHWGAFAGTDLENVLRQRGVDTVVLGGVSTNVGVESTARQGTGLGFAFVIAEDACAARDAEAHRHACEKIFPRLARVRKTEQILAALS